MAKGFTVEAVVTRCSSLSDGGMSIGMHTKELSAEDKVQVMAFHGQTGWVLFREDEVKEAEIPKQDSSYETKTPSQRLRGVLFILYQQLGETGDFEQFYREEMEKIINRIKLQLY
jgi:hypothetical protein